MRKAECRFDQSKVLEQSLNQVLLANINITAFIVILLAIDLMDPFNKRRKAFLDTFQVVQRVVEEADGSVFAQA